VKRTIAVCFAGVLIFAGVASAASPTARIAKLEKQVKTLTATVQKQQAVINCIEKAGGKCVTLKAATTSISNALNATIFVAFCTLGVTADALQSTWTTLDAANHTTLFGPQQTISDADTCGPLQITRQGIRNPPTTSVFSALTALLSRRTAAFRFG
jgi:outer membrane murein-binding lipoprotein Lpp